MKSFEPAVTSAGRHILGRALVARAEVERLTVTLKGVSVRCDVRRLIENRSAPR